MLENLLAVIREENLSEQLYHSLVGIKLTEHRVDQHGHLSRRPQPRAWANRPHHPYLREGKRPSQVTLVTEPNPNIGGILDRLDTLQTVAYRSLEGDDRIWPLSLPPKIDAAELASAGAGHQTDWLTGVKISYSLPDPVIHRLYSHYTADFDSVVAFKNELYFRVAQNFVRYQWLLTYLFGATPMAEPGFLDTLPELPQRPVRSLRYCGALPAGTPVTYTSLGAHLGALQRLAAAGDSAPAGPVTLKGQPTPQDFLTGGIGYLEFNGFDNTPFTANGVSRHALYFLKTFMIYLLVTPLPTTNLAAVLTAARQQNIAVALEQPDQPTQFQTTGEEIFHAMKTMAQDLHAHTEQWGAIDDLGEVLTHPELTPAAKIMTRVDQHSLMDYGLRVANAWRYQRLNSVALLPVYKDLNFRCQHFILMAMQAGIQFYQVKDEFGADLLMFTYQGVTQVLQERDTQTKDPRVQLRELFPELPEF
ncbi:gamma-glutamylcysteine synthetase [Levilactobacillus zymae]|uniref:gamma-glutamylcysteine synthetase n=1 Tax=Levilactobacillus zymae TaxID=267363 RepID=UPI003FCE63B4